MDKLSPIARCSGPNVFGCELGDGRTIELNIRDFSFTSHDDETPLFGRGSVSIDVLLVWLHELGDLLGLTHESIGGVNTTKSVGQSEASTNLPLRQSVRNRLDGTDRLGPLWVTPVGTDEGGTIGRRSLAPPQSYGELVNCSIWFRGGARSLVPATLSFTAATQLPNPARFRSS